MFLATYIIIWPGLMAGIAMVLLGVILLTVWHTGKRLARQRPRGKSLAVAVPVGGVLALVLGVGILVAAVVGAGANRCSAPESSGPSPSVDWEREATGRSMPFAIVRLDTESLWHKQRQIRIEVETWDRSADAPVPLTADALAVSVDGAWLPGTFTVETVESRAEPLALAVVVANDDHIDAAMRAAIDDGLAAYGSTLRKDDPKWIRSDTPMRALEKLMQLDSTLPPRRHVVVIGDGHRAGLEDARAMTGALDYAFMTRARVELIGIEVEPSALSALEELTLKTDGAVRKLPASEAAQRIPAAIASLGRELESRWVITFTPDDYEGSSQAIDRFELSARAPDGRFARYTVESVKIPMTCY